MHLAVWFSLPLLALATLACSDRTLTGAEAEAAYAAASASVEVVPEERLVFVNDRPLAAGERLDQLDPTHIERIEVLKGEAALRLYGKDARNGVIRIYTAAGPGAESGGVRRIR